MVLTVICCWEDFTVPGAPPSVAVESFKVIYTSTLFAENGLKAIITLEIGITSKKVLFIACFEGDHQPFFYNHLK